MPAIAIKLTIPEMIPENSLIALCDPPPLEVELLFFCRQITLD
jgi:hypothetical protein